MLIRVIYSNGRHDMVKPELLDRLIDDQKVRHFRRASGWTTPGRDPVRYQLRRALPQDERRSA